jgi:hypothetical protein
MPQLKKPLMRSTQKPLQSVLPGGQVHVPFWHVCPKLHPCLHIPQLFQLVCRSTHELPQSVLLPEQPPLHTPPLHVWPIGHGLPQLPQF